MAVANSEEKSWIRANSKREFVWILTDSREFVWILINDFLSVSENHILDDLNRCVLAVREHDPDTLDRTAGAIRGRCARVCGVVLAECDLYEPDEVINKIVESVCVLRDQLVASFAHAVEFAVGTLQSNGDVADDNGFIECARLVYDGALLLSYMLKIYFVTISQHNNLSLNVKEYIISV